MNAPRFWGPALAGLLVSCHPPAAPAPAAPAAALVAISPGHIDRFRDAFNADADQVRVVALLSPT